MEEYEVTITKRVTMVCRTYVQATSEYDAIEQVEAAYYDGQLDDQFNIEHDERAPEDIEFDVY